MFKLEEKRNQTFIIEENENVLKNTFQNGGKYKRMNLGQKESL